MVMQNCWLLYQANKKTEDPTLDLLTFRRENVNTYLKNTINLDRKLTDLAVAEYFLQTTVLAWMLELIE